MAWHSRNGKHLVQIQSTAGGLTKPPSASDFYLALAARYAFVESGMRGGNGDGRASRGEICATPGRPLDFGPRMTLRTAAAAALELEPQARSRGSAMRSFGLQTPRKFESAPTCRQGGMDVAVR